MLVSHQILQQRQRTVGLFSAIEHVTLRQISRKGHICGNVLSGVLCVVC